jgi:phospholipid-binding lipoprotein MlaA
MKATSRICALAVSLLALAGAAFAQEPAAPAEAPVPAGPNDPWERVNRFNYRVTMAVDAAALAPTARTYRRFTPGFARTGLSNLVANLGEPASVANSLLQGDFANAAKGAGRFGLNSTVGVGGLIDIAGHAGLHARKEDFGQTLGRWGAPAGPYVFLPLLGPSNLRDALARPIDAALDPFSYLEDGAAAFAATRTSLGVVIARERSLEAFENLNAAALDPYVSIRSLATLQRAGAVENNTDRAAPPPPAFEEMPEP